MIRDSLPGALPPLPTSPGLADKADLDTDIDWARKAWLADMRQNLTAPVNAVIELSGMMLKDARERGPQDFADDLRKILDAGERLLALMDEALDPLNRRSQEANFGEKLRHELRTPLNPIINYCELWLEDASDLLLEGFVADVRKVQDYGKQILARLDDIVKPPREPVNAALWEHLPGLPRRTPPRVESGSVLVVDDNPINLDILGRWLQRDGHAVTLAQDGREALALLEKRQFDLVLLDFMMPEMNGFQVLEKLKSDARLWHIPVIMISALGEMDSVVRCIEIGAEDYLPKPCNRVLLQARINACLEKKRLIEQIKRERQRSDELLHVILPADIVKELKENSEVKPRRHENVGVLFCDVVDFTPYCDHNEPEAVVSHLQQLIERWEVIALRHDVQKIKTIGDAFMAAAGLLQPTADHPVLHCVRCGLDMIDAAKSLGVGWQVRVGIHAGPVVAGVIGRRQYLFDLWGDAVNTAARMESNGVPGAVVLSGPAWRQVADRCRGESRGTIPVKGKGHMELFRFDAFIT